MKTPRRDQILFRFGEGFRVIHVESVRRYTLEALKDGKRSVHEEPSLRNEAAAGALSDAVRTKRWLLASVLLGIPHTSIAVPRTQPWTDVIQHLRYIQRLVSSGAFDLPWRDLWGAVLGIGKAFGDAKVPHPSTVRRWRTKHSEARRFSRALGSQRRSPPDGANDVPGRQTHTPHLRVVR